MAILKEPLFSEEARGQVAKTMVFKRGLFHPILSPCSYHPINWTPAKIAHAKAWKVLCNAWRSLSDAEQAAWRSYAPGVLTGFNFFMQNAGVLPFPPCYSPPDAYSLFYDFLISPYTPPDGDQLTFIFPECQ